MSEHTYQRSILVGSHWDLDSTIATSVSESLPGKEFRVVCSGDTVHVIFDDDLTTEEVTSLDSVVAAYRSGAESRILVELKEQRVKEIDSVTDDLILGGFEHQNMQFEATLEAQSRMLALLVMSLHPDQFPPAAVFPITWNSKDDSEVLELTQGSDVIQLVMACIGTYRAHIDSGTALKAQVRAASTISEVLAVEDNR